MKYYILTLVVLLISSCNITEPHFLNTSIIELRSFQYEHISRSHEIFGISHDNLGISLDSMEVIDIFLEFEFPIENNMSEYYVKFNYGYDGEWFFSDSTEIDTLLLYRFNVPIERLDLQGTTNFNNIFYINYTINYHLK